ncbi:MAG TPA: hypothetical protein VJB08_06640 [Candidatus Nanoarchaeia archaeon]|nr:hypothetical protein [Candidatus Nanoarchaeia archaeon]
MQVFDAIPKQWGNSVGITIPREVLERENISAKKKTRFIAIGSEMNQLKRAFGSLKLKNQLKKRWMT